MSAWEHFREDGVVVVETRVLDEVDEELRVTGVAAPRGDADRPQAVQRADLVAHEGGLAPSIRSPRDCRPG